MPTGIANNEPACRTLWKPTNATPRGWKSGAAIRPPAPNLYSALMVADALGLPYDYVREKLARHCGDDEPAEVAEPVDSPYRHPDGDPKYDLDT